MSLADGASTSQKVQRGDTVSVAGQTITARDACGDNVVLTLGAQAGALSGPTTTG